MRIVTIMMIAAVLTTASARNPDIAAVYTVEQAEGGRIALQQNSFGDCTSCHTTALTGRIGAVSELPALASLPENYQKLITGNGGRVPPLVGTEFVGRWGKRSTRHLFQEFEKRFSPPAGQLSADTRLEMIAYMLQASGAPAGAEPLTPVTDVPLASIFPLR